MVVLTEYDQHWEPPEATKLLITVHRLAEILHVPLWKAYIVSYSLGRIYYGRKATHVRVAMASVRTYQRLIEQGLNDEQARDALGPEQPWQRSGLTRRSYTNHSRRGRFRQSRS